MKKELEGKIKKFLENKINYEEKIKIAEKIENLLEEGEVIRESCLDGFFDFFDKKRFYCPDKITVTDCGLIYLIWENKDTSQNLTVQIENEKYFFYIYSKIEKEFEKEWSIDKKVLICDVLEEFEKFSFIIKKIPFFDFRLSEFQKRREGDFIGLYRNYDFERTFNYEEMQSVFEFLRGQYVNEGISREVVVSVFKFFQEIRCICEGFFIEKTKSNDIKLDFKEKGRFIINSSENFIYIKDDYIVSDKISNLTFFLRRENHVLHNGYEEIKYGDGIEVYLWDCPNCFYKNAKKIFDEWFISKYPNFLVCSKCKKVYVLNIDDGYEFKNSEKMEKLEKFINKEEH